MAKAKKLPSGNWNVVVYAGEENGKRKYESFTAETKKEAEFAAAEYTLKRKERQKGNITLQEAMNRYIDSKGTVLSPSTVRGYQAIVKNHFLTLQARKLRDVTREDIQKAVDEEAKTHSPKTVTNAYGLLSATLDLFLPEFRLKITLPKKIKTETYIPTDADIKKLLAHVHGTPIETPILLAATGSLRRGEISALTPEDVTDFGVTVNKTMVATPEGKWVLKLRPKTNAGYRFTPLPPSVIQILRTGLPTYTPNQIYNYFTRALKACGLPHFKFHSLRHYYASTLHALGVPDKYIMRNGGWETDTVLKNIYQHTISDRAEAENQKVVNFFEHLNSNDN